MLRHALAILALLLCASLPAEEVAVLVDGSKPGTYLVTVDAEGGVSAVPLRVVRPGQQPGPPDNPGPADPFEREVQRLTQAALNSGGTKTTGAALASVYGLVADGVADGSISLDNWPAAVKRASDAVATSQADGAKWADFRAKVGAALTTLRAAGDLGTKAEVADALKRIEKGMNRATGFKGSIPEILDAGAAGRAPGILDGFDLTRLLDLVRLIMELLKGFG